MAHQWKAGDLAVCVALTIPGRPVPSKILRLGRIYRVKTVRWSVGDQCVALGLDGVYSKGPRRDWHAEAFRPILPAEPCFTEAMRSLRPKVEA